MLTRHLGDLWTLHVISCSDEHVVIGIKHYESIPPILKGDEQVAIGPSLRMGLSPDRHIQAAALDYQRRRGANTLHMTLKARHRLRVQSIDAIVC